MMKVSDPVLAAQKAAFLPPTGLCQSHTEGIKECDGPEYTVMDSGRRKTSPRVEGLKRDEANSLSNLKKEWAPQGPDPGGVQFLAMENWVGIVDGYIHKNGDLGCGYYRNSPTPKTDVVEKDWTTASDSELRIASFGEGIPGQVASKEDSQETVVVYKDEEKTQMPFGMVETAPFLELLWRQTGADCDGEEEEMEFPGGGRYKILLCESRGNL